MSGKISVGIAALAFVLHLAVQAPFLDEPFGDGHDASVSVQYALSFTRSWEEFGFFATEGRRLYQNLPLAEPNDGIGDYGCHPPLAHWLHYLASQVFGTSARGLRILPVFLSALAGALLAFIATRRRGLWTGVAAGLVYSSLPMALIFGRMASYESLLLVLGLAATIVHLEDRATRRLSITGILLFLCCLVDWPAYWLVAMLAVTPWWLPDPDSRRRVRAVLLAGVLAGAAYIGLLTYWFGTLANVKQWFNWAYANRIDTAASSGFFVEIPAHMNELYGWPILGAAALGVALSFQRLLSRRADTVDTIVVIWFLVGAVHTLVFPGYAVVHDFWTYYLMPAIVFGVSEVVGLLAAKSNAVLAALLLALLVGYGASRSRAVHDELQASRRTELFEWAHARFDHDSLVVQYELADASYWALRTSTWITRADTQQEALDLIERFRAGEFTTKKLVIWFASGDQDVEHEAMARALGGTFTWAHGTCLATLTRDP